MLIHIWLVGIGGFFGAICRYFVTMSIQKYSPGKIPIGTLAVNLLGSFLLGFLLAAAEDDKWTLLLGTGFMGAFTTFSTFNIEAIKLLNEKENKTAFIYIALTISGGIILGFLGMLAGKIGRGV